MKLTPNPSTAGQEKAQGTKSKAKVGRGLYEIGDQFVNEHGMVGGSKDKAWVKVSLAAMVPG